MIPKAGRIKYIILILGLIANTFSGLNWNVGIAAWIAPVLLLYFSKNSRWYEFLFLFLGLACSSAISKTAENLSGLFIIYITTGVGYGIVFSLPYLLEKLLTRKGKSFYSTLIFPSAVVVTEYVLSLAIGVWGNTSIAQHHNLNLIQITSVFGIFGISFLVAWLASILNWAVKNGIITKGLWKGLAIYGTVIVAVFLYGFIRTGVSPAERESVKVAAIVGETDIHRIFYDWEEEIIELSKNYEQEIPAEIYSESIDVDLLINRTEKALSNDAKIVVWNEISLLLLPSQTDSLVQRVKELCVKNQTYVLMAILEKDRGELLKPLNNKSIFVGPDGEIVWEYLKHFLNPLAGLVINKGDGPIPYIDTEYGRLANAICSDIDLSGYISQIGRDSVDILMVPAFDWEEVTPYHANMAAFAAIQYGVSIIRANGKGIGAFYDYLGRVLEQNNTFTSDSKITYAEIPLNSTTTVYSKIGNLFVYLLMLLLLIMVGLRISKRSAI